MMLPADKAKVSQLYNPSRTWQLIDFYAQKCTEILYTIDIALNRYVYLIVFN